ncbi:leucine-rich repeat domain-containing protein [Candidatus Neomarinimicrobiota bacterium]
MRISHTFSAIAIAFITGIIISCSLNPAEEDPEPIIVNFPDPNFEMLIREVLNIPTRDITNQDMWSIKDLIGIDRNISDITGIEFCSGLQTLIIRDNNISDLEPLRDLVLINTLILQRNKIEDIKYLVENTGIGLGDDKIYIEGNPLNDESILDYKPQLQSRGVKFYSDAELSTSGAINFMDNNFETVIREHLDIPVGDILSSDLAEITNISARDRNISNIYGIEFCINLDTLNLGMNQISDLIPLYYIRTLTRLILDNNTIEDIEPLRELGRLNFLDLNYNNPSQISALSNLQNLTSLFLDYTYINDISPISSLINLNYLTLNGNPIDDFESLSGMDSLNGLELMDLNQFNISNIKDLINLQVLYLSNTPVLNLVPITNITSLQALIMKNCNLSNIGSLANLSNLQKLFLNDNNISNIYALSELYELYELKLENNNISDILPLVTNWGISGGNDYVFLMNNPLSEISINTYIPQLENRDVHVYF